VNEYPPGVGLSPHVDTHSSFTDFLVSLSLAGPATMSFRRAGVQHSVHLAPRTLLVMSGEARLAWDHSVPQRKVDPVETPQGVIQVERSARRVSLTFRAVREGPCECAFPEQCDSQNGGPPPTRMAQSLGHTEQQEQHDCEDTLQQEAGSSRGAALEAQHVSNVYDAIAPHFSATRFAIWPKVRAFIDSLPPAAIVADVGCGNGKYFAVRDDLYVSGSDRSIGLVHVAARRLVPSTAAGPARADVLLADGLHLPYRPGSCDAALCIAVLHHMSTLDRRTALLQQLHRLLRLGGRAIVTVWATQQENMGKVAKWQRLEGSDAADYLVPWHLPLHRAEASRAAGLGPTLDGAKNSLVFSRYYHLFEQAELEGLVEGVEGLALVASFYDKDNWCVVVERCN
jgi:alkylated DNA repair protein alkB family protein 8